MSAPPISPQPPPPSYDESSKHPAPTPNPNHQGQTQFYPPQGSQYQQYRPPQHPSSVHQFSPTVYPSAVGYLPNNQTNPPYPPPNNFSGSPYYATAAGGASDMVYLQQPGVNAVSVPIPMTTFGYNSTQTICHLCNQSVVTRVSHTPGAYAWCMCVMIAVMGFGFPLIWFGLCFIPFCIKSCKDTVHTCPSCKQHIRTVSRSGGTHF